MSSEKLKNDQHLQKKLKTFFRPLPNGWWIEEFFSETYPSRLMRKNRGQEHIIDKKIYYCKSCRRVWEYCPNYISSTEDITYQYLPSIGKTRKVCINCKGKEHE